MAIASVKEMVEAAKAEIDNISPEEAARRASEYGIHKLEIIISGSGAGRETAVRTLQNMGMDIGTIKDVTPTPHNGCRQKKRKRG